MSTDVSTVSNLVAFAFFHIKGKLVDLLYSDQHEWERNVSTVNQKKMQLSVAIL